MTVVFEEVSVSNGVIDHKHTVEELINLSYAGKEYELLEGQFVEMPGPSIKHGAIIITLGQYLNGYATQQRVGAVMSNTAFVLDRDNAPRPDVAFVLQARLQGVDYDDAFPGRPDLAVEVVSRTDLVYDVADKIALYLRFEVPLVWLIEPRSKLVFVYHPGSNKPLVLGVDDELDGETLLAGFKLKVSTLFE